MAERYSYFSVATSCIINTNSFLCYRFYTARTIVAISLYIKDLEMKCVLLCAVVSCSTVSFAGISPGGLADPTSANIGRTRVVVVDDSTPFHRSRGDELIGSTFSGGSSSTSSSQWRADNSYFLDMFYETESLQFNRSGLVGLNDLGDASRMQGIETQDMFGSVRILEQVEYTLRVVVTPTLLESSGDSVATLGFDFAFDIIGGDFVTLRDSQNIDLMTNTDEYVYEYSGVFDPEGSIGRMSFSSGSILSTVIDEAGESVQASYDMAIVLSLSPIPTPSAISLFGVAGLLSVRRRR